VLATLTEEGRRAYEAGAHAQAAAEADLLSGLSGQEQAQLTDLLTRLGSHAHAV
jgi:DNA-binding MarR family transcriptional regulator